MAILGKSFEFNYKSSDDFNLRLVSLDHLDEYPMGLSKEILRGETTLNRNVANHFGTRYESPLSFEFTIAKKDFGTFTRKEIADINAWLTSPKIPTLLHFVDCDEGEEYVDYFGCFLSSTNFNTSGIVMLTYTFECNAPYGWSKERVVTHQSTAVESTFTCNNDSDEYEEFIYPKIKIESTAGTSITIRNRTEYEQFTMTYPANDLPVYIDTRNHRIYQIIGGEEALVNLDNIGWDVSEVSSLGDAVEGIYWLRLVHGQNDLVCTGDFTITLTYRVPRKVGAY